MNVYGIDFTSSPSARDSQAKAAKWMTLASCNLEGKLLIIDSFEKLNGEKKDDYSPFVSTLSSDGPWIAGIDVPFGMPLECIEYFRWLRCDDAGQDWSTYVERCRTVNNRKKFKQLIESWRHPIKTNSKGENERVRKYRLVDKPIGAQSPMNCIRPAVGSMFYEVCGRIRSSPASIPPVRIREGETRTIVEAYPRLVADRFIGNNNYKEADGLEDVRKHILEQMSCNESDSIVRTWYGVSIEIEDDLANQCVKDRDGDKLDSVMCALQAAWSWKSPNRGMPICDSSVVQSVIALEGWVADPYLSKWSNPMKEASEAPA